MSSTNEQRIILVTGADKGLGFECVKKLVNEGSGSTNDLILLGSRDIKRGEDAIAKLGSPSNVKLIQLDTSSPDSITRVADEIKQKYGGKLDIIINNAGVGSGEINVKVARDTFATNYYGIKLLNQQLSPFIRENGRIVNVASEAGAWTLYDMSNDLQQKYKSSTLTVEELDQLVEQFISSIESNSSEQLGYNVKPLYLIYGVSKAAVIALTKIEARQWSGAKNVLVFAVCPGACETDMNTSKLDARPPELGAESILYPVRTPANQLENGQFYQDGQLKPQSFKITSDPNLVARPTQKNQ